MGEPEKDPIGQLRLPAGFRFYPTDEELLIHYLCRKVAGHEFSVQIIADIDLYKFDPWVLPGKAVFGEKEWYFFSPRDRKYPNGSRPNRVAGCGYWKATGTDKLITSRGRKVGIKKALVFYMGRAPHGTKTNWIMHEYRLFDSPRSACSSKLDDWVLCRIYKKNSSANSTSANEHSAGGSATSSATSLETSPARPSQQKLVLENYGSVNLDWGELARLTAGPEFGVSGPLNQGGHVINNGSGTCVSSMLCHVATPQPQEKLIERVPGGFFNMSPNMYPNLADPFGRKYPVPNPVAAFRFRH